MMGHLHLTSKDAKVVVLEDESDEDLAHSDWAVIGKVLAPNVLHIQTIKSALRAAWGNPKDLVMSSAGNNTFMAEFASQADRTRVLEGSPWMVGRIMNLSLGWMTEHWGKTLAEQVGDVKKTDVDAQGHCWGIFMCMRVEVDVDNPLLRGITVYSNHKKTMEWDVLDEVEIRQLLIDHVSHRCCWGSRPARTWKITSIEDCNVYVGTLETFIEERDIVSKKEPYEGGKIDGRDKGPVLGV